VQGVDVNRDGHGVVELDDHRRDRRGSSHHRAGRNYGCERASGSCDHSAALHTPNKG
jgi:hypothetical protein